MEAPNGSHYVNFLPVSSTFFSVPFHSKMESFHGVNVGLHLSEWKGMTDLRGAFKHKLKFANVLCPGDAWMFHVQDSSLI